MNRSDDHEPGGGGSVLLVDDDAMTRSLYSMCLRRVGFDVVCASSGADALTLLSEQTFDLMLLDIVMPELSGIELLEQLPGHELVSMPQIIMLSGTENTSVTARCEALGATMVLIKPVPAAILQAQVRRVLRS